ncbi:hypothetical protein L13192_06056 [Pyrenophora tritici-repentis]|uniref:Uncharacterized protein n=1 Tax=Pyrenophora tritici-repentis TaxID=45151 RepID=A0A2W1D1Z2_9PLEO|nr:hypothetical protein Alg215_04907 [Pyrenophora tritici-repentis]KAI1516900.1 hypothetical protein Ptr86124_003837 [Pyrenophora tritici-repentis]KAI1670540.1 hypothetical protein L13192_06056 [Pyrenophora tritici-repentis]KAI1682165.1 hypothetical protein KJE20_09036 [Pyrenophora tritici-repentis]PZC91997.1 hypothetical protein A1F95_08329 [Pyrenophora tritici-repentis]
MFADTFANFAFGKQAGTTRQHNMEAPLSTDYALQPFRDTYEHDPAFKPNEPLEKCTRTRCFTRRGGIADRGEGSYSTAPIKRRKASDGETDGLIYQSDAIHEEHESKDSTSPPSPPLSPKTIVLPRMRTRQRGERKRNGHSHASSKRRPSWKPNLKNEFVRRGSIDAIMALFNEQVWYDSDMNTCFIAGRRRSSVPATEGKTEFGFTNTDRTNQRRPSTLLHPSSPTLGPTANYTCYQPTPLSSPPHKQTPSTASPTRPTMPARRGSSLLHPSRPSSEILLESPLKTIIKLPPTPHSKSQPRTPTTRHASPSASPKQRRLQKSTEFVFKVPEYSLDASSCDVSGSASKYRKGSVIHSCLSESESDDEELDELPPLYMGRFK